MRKELPANPKAFLEGQFLLINKPKTWTSFDVVNKVRYTLKKKLGIKKIKVGHAGTLDPLATGLLLLATGKNTKRLEDLTGLNKQYTGSIQFGSSTPSYDAETEVDETYPTDHLSAAFIEEKLANFRGQIEQVPPVFSAIKVNGVPLYKKARKGITVEVKSRSVRIDRFDLVSFESPIMEFLVDCSKGTYIRSLAHDLGKACESGAYLKSLVRTKIGAYLLEDAWEVEDFVSAVDEL